MRRSEYTSKASTSEQKASTINLGIWTGAWLVTMAVASFGPALLWESRLLTLVAILINVAFGIGMIRANIRYLHGIDELMQRIQLEAMGLALGVTIVAGLAYSMLDTSDVIPFDAEIGFLVMLTAVTYIAATAIGMRRYR